MLAIDQCAETARVYYLSRPYSIGVMEDNIPKKKDGQNLFRNLEV